MSKLSDKYRNIISDIEKHISDENERKYVVNKIEEIPHIYIELIDRITKIDNDRIEELEEHQMQIEDNLAKLLETVNLIKNDIYEEDSYDFEIVCPYCNKEFVADIESELKEEIICPECNNIIELDWNNEDDVGCTSCGESSCAECANNYKKDEFKKDNNEKENDSDDEDDDM